MFVQYEFECVVCVCMLVYIRHVCVCSMCFSVFDSTCVFECVWYISGLSVCACDESPVNDRLG